MINVYLVTAGSYSDYGIHGVFSTREKAKEFIKNAQSIKDNSNPSNPEYSHYVWENPFRGEIEQFNVKVPVYNNRPIVRTRSTVSVDHAVKLAAEKRQEWLRNRVHKNPNSEDAQ